MDEKNDLISEPIVNIEMPPVDPVVNSDLKIENVDKLHEHKYDTLYDSGELLCGECLLNKKGVFRKPQEEKKLQRNEKGQFLQGNQESKGLTNSGRPCGYCQRPIEILNKINLYREWCRGKVDGKLHIPWLEELISEDYLDITISQLEDWRTSKKHSEQHSELNLAIDKIWNRQRLMLMKKTIFDDSRGCMFLLSANHGLIEKSKQYQAGDKNEPLEYNINIVPRKKQEELGDE